jgi:hypothetical protein
MPGKVKTSTRAVSGSGWPRPLSGDPQRSPERRVQPRARLRCPRPRESSRDRPTDAPRALRPNGCRSCRHLDSARRFLVRASRPECPSLDRGAGLRRRPEVQRTAERQTTRRARRALRKQVPSMSEHRLTCSGSHMLAARRFLVRALRPACPSLDRGQGAATPPRGSENQATDHPTRKTRFTPMGAVQCPSIVSSTAIRT